MEQPQLTGQPTHSQSRSRRAIKNQSFRQQCISTKKMSSHRCDNSHFHFTKFSILNRSTYLFVQFYCPFIVIRYYSDVLHQMVRVHFSLTQTDIIGSLIFKNQATGLTAPVHCCCFSCERPRLRCI